MTTTQNSTTLRQMCFKNRKKNEFLSKKNAVGAKFPLILRESSFLNFKKKLKKKHMWTFPTFPATTSDFCFRKNLKSSPGTIHIQQHFRAGDSCYRFRRRHKFAVECSWVFGEFCPGSLIYAGKCLQGNRWYGRNLTQVQVWLSLSNYNNFFHTSMVIHDFFHTRITEKESK